MELMIAVAVLGALATIALPEMNFAIQNARVRTATSDTHTSLLLARSEAIKRNAAVNLNRGGASWAAGWTVTSGGTTLITQDPLSGVTAECYTTPTASSTCGAALSFTRTGRAGSYIEFRYYVAANDNVPMRCVRVDLSGRPGVTVDGNGDTTDGCN